MPKNRENETKMGRFMHDRSRIRDLHANGVRPIEIARIVGCSRSSVYRALAPGAAVHYQRAPKYADAIERVRDLVYRYPLMDGPALKVQASWPGSLRQLQAVVHPMRFPALQAAKADGVLLRPADHL